MQPVLHDDRWPGKPLELATQKRTALALDEGAHIGTVQLLVSRPTLALTRQAAGLRSGAAVPAPAERLAPDMCFFYLVVEEPGQTELPA
ncbi:MAG TPA: hypothetical protein VF933_31625 [Streptosporangiaceae bacterium]